MSLAYSWEIRFACTRNTPHRFSPEEVIEGENLEKTEESSSLVLRPAGGEGGRRGWSSGPERRAAGWRGGALERLSAGAGEVGGGAGGVALRRWRLRRPCMGEGRRGAAG